MFDELSFNIKVFLWQWKILMPVFDYFFWGGGEFCFLDSSSLKVNRAGVVKFILKRKLYKRNLSSTGSVIVPFEYWSFKHCIASMFDYLRAAGWWSGKSDRLIIYLSRVPIHLVPGLFSLTLLSMAERPWSGPSREVHFCWFSNILSWAAWGKTGLILHWLRIFLNVRFRNVTVFLKDKK